MTRRCRLSVATFLLTSRIGALAAAQPATAQPVTATSPPAAAHAAPAPAPAGPLAASPRVAAALETLRIWLDAQRDYEQIPGLSVAVVHDQEVLWSGGIGVADRQRRVPAGPDTLYSICSISKLFTAIAVMQQRDAGRLRLDDAVSRHLPWFSMAPGAPASGEATVGALLTHSSGLPRETGHAYWTGPDFTFPDAEAIRGRQAGRTALYPADTYFQYSNLGLTLAGEVAAAAAGMPYDTLVRTRILAPLGLASTFPHMREARDTGRLATGYGAVTREGTRAPVRFFDAEGVGPAAGFASTADDLARFASWQFRLLRTGTTEVLAATTLREMQRVHWMDPDFSVSRGLGFRIWRHQDRTFVGHAGSCPGFRTELLLKPDERIAIVLLANAQGVNTGTLAQSAYDLVAPAIREATREGATPPPARDPALGAYLGTYASGFAGETAIVPWEDGLAAFGVPDAEPVRNLAKLKKTGPHTFRRVRKDGALGEEIVFEPGPDGRSARLTWHDNVYTRVK
jgi:CubicO group peptidase (beta-lactamase class C family)